MRPCLLSVLILLVATTPAKWLHGQATGETRVIAITVTDPSGAPFVGLRPEDLILRIDGRVHPVTIEGIYLPGWTESPLPPPYARSADVGNGISVAVDVTRLASDDLPMVRESINTLLGVLHPRDRVSITALADDGFTTDYTSRPELVRAIAGKLPATAQPMQETQALEAAAVKSLSLLELRCTILGTDTDHKTLVYIAPPFAATSNTRRAIQSVAAAAARQQIHLVIIEPRGDASPSGGLSVLAAATGATLLAVSPDLSKRLSGQVGRSVTRLGIQFTVTKDEQDDKLHRLQVMSLRKDVVVSAPPQIFIARNGTASQGLAALTDMLRQPRAWRDLPLRLAAFPTLDVERDRLRVLVLGEPEPAMRPLAWARFALIAPSGAMVAEWTAEGADLTTRPIMTSVLVPPGPYRLRMVASELTGLRGSVDYEFDVRLTPAGSLNLGPLMFGGIANQAFMPILQMPPEAPGVMAYTEIYGRIGETDTLSSRFEVDATVNGGRLATIDASIRPTPDNDRRAALGTIDLTALEPGDYVVRAVVSLNGKEIGRVTRTLRKAAQ
jgi:hypothetical protein